MITLNDAKRIIAAAEKKANEIGQPMNASPSPTPEETWWPTCVWMAHGLEVSTSQ